MAAKLPRQEARRNAEQRRREATIELLVEGISESGGGCWRLSGDSMRPLLRHGDRLWIVPSRDPAKGEIVLFERRGQLICHRVLSVDPLELAGDYNRRLDRIDAAAVLGVVAAAERSGRRLALDRGPVAWAGKLLAAWHRLDRRWTTSRVRAGRALELARLAALHVLALGWLLARRRSPS